MRIPKFRDWGRATLGVCLSTLLAMPNPAYSQPNDHHKTDTPIKHVIVLIGENRSFDNLFATYVPKSHDSVKNLLSEGIINADGTPGPHFKKAQQFQAVAPFRTEYYISLNDDEKAPYDTLPSPTLNFSPSPDASIIGFATEPPPFPPATPPATAKAALVRPPVTGTRRSTTGEKA